ncbi:MAG: AgmX/PglI C-terminal domain-containing protein [Deltaproteobacteria bacterium]|nr:AgmX/PglI C-terminal domain-containing protein [Deltaproteobacteria bacterium]
MAQQHDAGAPGSPGTTPLPGPARQPGRMPGAGLPLPLWICMLLSMVLHQPVLLWPAEPLTSLGRRQLERQRRVQFLLPEPARKETEQEKSEPLSPLWVEPKRITPQHREEIAVETPEAQQRPSILDAPPLPPSGGKATAIFLKHFSQPWNPLPIGRGSDSPEQQPGPLADWASYGLRPGGPVPPGADGVTVLRPAAPSTSGIAEHLRAMQRTGQEKQAREKALRARLQQLPIQVKGQLEQKVILRIIRAELQAIRICYENSLWNDPSLQGRVTVRFIIGNNGQVKEANLASLTIRDEAMLRCIENRFRAMKYPSFVGEEVKVNYSIVFSQKE